LQNTDATGRKMQEFVWRVCFFFFLNSALGLISLDMETGQRDAVTSLQGLAEDPNFDAGATHFDMEGVLDGSERIDISHAGGEMGSWEDDIEEGSDEEGPEVKRR
jgi:hypothetical protein